MEDHLLLTWRTEKDTSTLRSNHACDFSHLPANCELDKVQRSAPCTHLKFNGHENRNGTRLSSCCAHNQDTANANTNARRRPHIHECCFLSVLRLAIVVAVASVVSAQTTTTKWCNSNNEPDDPLIELCFEPSVGPIAGGVMVTVKGMQRAASMQAPAADWRSKCSDASWWTCTFARPEGTFASPLAAIRSSCEFNYIVCESPRQTISGDIFVSISRIDQNWAFPSPKGRNQIFSYYGTHRLHPDACMYRKSFGFEFFLMQACPRSSQLLEWLECAQQWTLRC